MTDESSLDDLRRLLEELGSFIRDRVIEGRDRDGVAAMRPVVHDTTADVVYAVDRVGEDAILEWFARRWPRHLPVRLVMEGVEDDELVTFPDGTPPDDVAWICIIDPVDGTRSLMYDKRSAWALTALAPVRPGPGAVPSARFGDIEVAVMTELPTTKQADVDQVGAVKGCGPSGIVARRTDLRAGTTRQIALTPSTDHGFAHGFCSFNHFFPDGKAILAAIEQRLWDDLVPIDGRPRQIFEDQYMCNGGQIYEVATGRDRLVGDLRPLVAEALRLEGALVTHPYDVCTSLVLVEAGGVFEDPWGRPVDVALDTTSPVAWVAYANSALAERVRPALAAAIDAVIGRGSA